MEVIRTLKPGTAGTRQYQEAHGEQLVCVRYRRDRARKRNLITVELIVEQVPQARPRALPELDENSDRKVFIEIGFEEAALRQTVKDAGARWDFDRKRWQLDYRSVRELGLGDRIDVEMSFPPPLTEDDPEQAEA